MLDQGAMDRIRPIVEREFTVLEARDEIEHLVFVVGFPYYELDDRLGKVQSELGELGYAALIQSNDGEFVLAVAEKPERPRRPAYLGPAFLVATLLTATWTGYVLTAQLGGGDFISYLIEGIWGFMIPIMVILGAHEFAHYYAARAHGMRAELPFFVPGFPPFGALLAFVSLRDPLPNRKAMIDIGLAGPLVGFLVSIPVLVIGLWLTAQNAIIPADSGEVQTIYWLGKPLVYLLLEAPFSIPAGALPHPMVWAGWLGLVGTAFNLLPVGIVDGGFVSRGVFGENAKYVGFGTVGALVLLYFMSGNILWILLGILLLFFGAPHPPPLNPISSLDNKRYAVIGIAVVVFIASFTVNPFVLTQGEVDFGLTTDPGLAPDLTAGTVVTGVLLVENQGTQLLDVDITAMAIPSGDQLRVTLDGDQLTIPKGENRSIGWTLVVGDITSETYLVTFSATGGLGDGPETRELDLVGNVSLATR